jgi:hypothetical protein
VLVIERLTKDEIKLAEKDSLDDYSVFMAIPKTAGIDKRGNPVYYKTPEGMEIEDENKEPIKDDEISLVAGSFAEWAKEGGYVRS